MGKPAQDLFAEFAGERVSPDPNRSGDVKYHLGYRSERQVADAVGCSWSWCRIRATSSS